MENTIAVVSDPIFLEHRASGASEHPERPERLRAAEQALSEANIPFARLERLPARDASDDELGRVHTGEYLETLSGISGREGYLDPDTYYAPGSYRAARRAAGGAVALVDALLDGHARSGVALVRPPGHHARPHSAMGFCLLNNAAVLAAHARARGAERVAIVDWDVHHGNGTQEIFYDDPSVLYISLHQSPFYPGTGQAEETGVGEGRGATINVPLSAGAGDAVYLAAFDRIIAPALAEFDADLVVVSAGFDAHERDPLAGMCVTERGYAGMTRAIIGASRQGTAGPDGRLAILLEGGYDLDGLRLSLKSTLESLESLEAGTPASSSPPPHSLPVQGIGPRHSAELGRALASAKQHFHLG